jgi:hypothetical protein
MVRLVLFTLGVLGGLAVFSVLAQGDDLFTRDVRLFTRQDVYGQEIRVAQGLLVNRSETGYTELSLLAEVYDANDTLVGEGVGYVVNACGAGLLPDYVLSPGAAHLFEATLELYTPDAEIDRVEFIPQGLPTDALPPQPVLAEGVTRVTDQEVVAVEWLDPRALRFGSGCDHALFTDYRWAHHSLRTGTTLPARHPRLDDVTEDMRERLGLAEDEAFANSMLAYAPGGTRLAFQGDINRFYTAEADGSFPRRVYEGFHNRTLQGIKWLPEGRFLAYYYGAFGDPVYYFTADVNARAYSLPPDRLPLSETVPGVTPDGLRALLGGAFDGENTGYYFKLLSNNSAPRLVLEAELPGNNYPAPLFATDAAGEMTGKAYLARLVDEMAVMQCLDVETGALTDLAPLPLQLTSDERAWWWLSPDGGTIALAANGVNGGLWLLDLTALPQCE